MVPISGSTGFSPTCMLLLQTESRLLESKIVGVSEKDWNNARMLKVRYTYLGEKSPLFHV
jgi:hypothetical protein